MFRANLPVLCSAPGKDGLQPLHHLTEIYIPPAWAHIAGGLVLANIVNKAKKRGTNNGNEYFAL